MKIAIMQPYFLPYIGYWQLINAVDKFVIYDNIEFSKSGWFHRNYFLLNNEKKLFTIPIQKDSDYLDVKYRFLAKNSEEKIKKIISQIQDSYKKAPFYEEVFPVIKKIFLNQEKNLFSYIYFSVKEITKFLEIDTEIIISSEINIDHSLRSQDKVIEINKKINSKEYYNSIGGLKLYEEDIFAQNGIKLLFLESEIVEYKQFNNNFIPYLSIIDILMFNSKESVKKMLNSYRIIRGK